MAGRVVTTLQDQEVDRLVRAAGGGRVVGQARAAADDGSTVVVLVVARAMPGLDGAGGQGTRPTNAATEPDAESAGRRQALTQRRREVCKTQEGLAMEVGVERSTVARWESGETTPSLWARPRLADALDVTLEGLDRILDVVSDRPRAVHVIHSGDEEVLGR